MNIRIIATLVAAALVWFLFPNSDMADKMAKVRQAKADKKEEKPEEVTT